MRHVSTAVFGLVLLASAAGARADQTDPRLDPLFARLAETESRAEARWLTARIWSLWYQHPNDSVEALLAAGRDALDDGDLEGALIVFGDAVRKAPNFAEAWNARATAHYLAGNYERSLADIRRTLTLEPRHFGALSGRGLCLMKLERPRDALAAFEASLEINPHQPGVRANRRLLQERLGEEAL
jgi:Flp pilus assembly protein TadD